MYIELSWPRPDAAHRTLAVPVPAVPAAELLRPALRLIQASAPGLLRQALAYAGPVAGSAAGAVGSGALAQLAVPYAARLARQALAQPDH